MLDLNEKLEFNVTDPESPWSKERERQNEIRSGMEI